MTNQAACSEAAEISKRLDLTACVYRLLNLVPRLISSFCMEIKEKPGNIGRFKPLSLTLSSSDGLAASNQITAFTNVNVWLSKPWWVVVKALERIGFIVYSWIMNIVCVTTKPTSENAWTRCIKAGWAPRNGGICTRGVWIRGHRNPHWFYTTIFGRLAIAAGLLVTQEYVILLGTKWAVCLSFPVFHQAYVSSQ